MTKRCAKVDYQAQLTITKKKLKMEKQLSNYGGLMMVLVVQDHQIMMDPNVPGGGWQMEDY